MKKNVYLLWIVLGIEVNSTRYQYRVLFTRGKDWATIKNWMGADFGWFVATVLVIFVKKPV